MIHIKLAVLLLAGLAAFSANAEPEVKPENKEDKD